MSKIALSVDVSPSDHAGAGHHKPALWEWLLAGVVAGCVIAGGITAWNKDGYPGDGIMAVEPTLDILHATSVLLADGTLPVDPMKAMSDRAIIRQRTAHLIETDQATGTRTLRLQGGGVFRIEKGPTPDAAVVTLSALTPDTCSHLGTLPLPPGYPASLMNGASQADDPFRWVLEHCGIGGPNEQKHSLSWAVSPMGRSRT